MEKQLLNILFKKEDNTERLYQFLKKKYPEEELPSLIYEISCEYLFCNNQSQVVEQVKKKEIGWNHPNFQTIADDFQEQDDFLEKPPQVEEGVMECKRCGSKRTFSFSKQTRRSDESATVFIRCSNCAYMYRI